MKHLITFFALAIFLQGNYTAQEEAIAKRYSPFFASDTYINVISSPGELEGYPNCGLSDDRTAIGCAVLYDNGYSRLSVKEGLTEEKFTLTMLHELGHQYFGASEESATDFSWNLFNYVNNLK